MQLKKLHLSFGLLLVIHSFLNANVCAIGKFSVFRIHSVKPAAGTLPLPKAKYGVLSNVYKGTIVNGSVNSKDATSVLKSVLNSTSSGTCDGVNFRRKGSFCTVSFPRKPFGWTTIGFKLNIKLVYRSKPSEIDSVIARLEFLSCGTAQSQGTLMLQFNVHLSNGTLHIHRRQSVINVSDKVTTKVVNAITSMLVKDLTREVSLRAARKRQLNAGKLLADAAAKARKRIELDRIIHPEKYRTKSATVRRSSGGSGDGGGNGRFTPSAATQARRTKSRGG